MNARDTFVNDNNKLKSPEELLQFAALPWRHDRQGNIRVLMVTSRERGRWTVPKDDS